ncbi:DUF2860 family protein [Desulfobotulus mexicanus]|uniref:DUF2860 domain-containing protein n=1 Tax=Desulfobotulus mexicanus TaxID=2586642 RepID=A0A5S5MCA9_9BACT|nr:DUF2860 family protein [Desulfobotulus mexicanus]TYT73289.1 DUF2860 domain-containing protein [Desulfobotulus mexicanus]
MPYLKPVLIWTLLILLPPVFVQAEGKPDPAPRFSGMIQTGGAFIQKKSQSDPDKVNRHLHSLNTEGQSFEKYLPLILFDLKFKNSTGTEFYTNTPIESDPGIAAGVSKRYSMGKVDVYGIYTMPGEAWEDPYLTGLPRIKTDIKSYGAGLKLGQIMGSPFGFEYKLRINDIEKDLSGQRIPELKRDGRTHGFELNYTFRNRSCMVTPKIGWILGDFEGKANAYNQLSSGLSFMKMSEKTMYRINLNYSIKNYKAEHPVFSKERQDHLFGIMAMLIRMKPFGYDRFSINLLAGTMLRDSNISFYDEKTYFAGLTLGYSF